MRFRETLINKLCNVRSIQPIVQLYNLISFHIREQYVVKACFNSRGLGKQHRLTDFIYMVRYNHYELYIFQREREGIVVTSVSTAKDISRRNQKPELGVHS